MEKSKRWSLERVVVLVAIAFGVAAGTYGIASAASGSGSSQSNGGLQSIQPAGNAPNAQRPWGRQRRDETLLSGDAAAKVKAIALARVPGGTIIRVETDADGNAAYEAHMVKADGTPATVYVNKQFELVKVESGMPAPPQMGSNSSNSSYGPSA
jgi:hypothetical protein